MKLSTQRMSGFLPDWPPQRRQKKTLPERVLIAREDGFPMREGHRLTRREREHAVRAILLSAVERRTKAH
jgi:hypothetical protein